MGTLEARPLPLSWNPNWNLPSHTHSSRGWVLIGPQRQPPVPSVTIWSESSCEEQRVLMAGTCKPGSTGWPLKLWDPGGTFWESQQDFLKQSLGTAQQRYLRTLPL